MILPVKIELRAAGLWEMREGRGLTHGCLAHELGISQNCLAPIEAGAARRGRSRRNRSYGSLVAGWKNSSRWSW
jgi:predicted transcriptional regulator